MRLATTLLLSTFSALHLTIALKAHGHSKHHNNLNHLSRSTALRQRHEPRALLDVCAYIDANLLGQQSILGIPLGELLDIDICLCLSALPLYLETNSKVLAVVEIFGLGEVSAFLEALINLSPTSKHCSYPAHSKSLCTAENVCGFNCVPPYVREGTYCVCQSPRTECNGQCGFFPRGCPSPIPHALTDRGTSHVHGARSINSYSRIKGDCKPGEQVCGTYGGGIGFECLDVETNLESCGGCAIPNPFLLEEAQVPGVDCSSLPGVHDVTCSSGACSVRRCKNGWELNKRGDACRPAQLGGVSDLVVQIVATRSSKKMKRVKIPPTAKLEDFGTVLNNGLRADDEQRASKANFVSVGDLTGLTTHLNSKSSARRLGVAELELLGSDTLSPIPVEGGLSPNIANAIVNADLLLSDRKDNLISMGSTSRVSGHTDAASTLGDESIMDRES